QQVLAYLNVPHDVEVQDPRRMYLRAHANEDDVSEGAPDYIASEQSPAESPTPATPPAPEATTSTAKLTTVAVTGKSAAQPANGIRAGDPSPAKVQPASLDTSEQARGTVVLDVAGGVLVPDFRGKSLRVALEEAESAGLELEVSGSGVGQEQSPVAGSRIAPGGHISVRFGR
ncbi:MAG: PASTA domain-containing protein, partial [Candidatus Angelobacter sp.]